MLGLRVQSLIGFAQLIDLGGEFVDLGQPLTQQQFQAADSALPVFQFAAQSNDLGAQSVILVFEQLEVGARWRGCMVSKSGCMVPETSSIRSPSRC